MLIIDREFQDLIPPLTADELVGLETNIKLNGCLDPLKVWKGHNILVDGHNRYQICTANNIPYSTIELQFDSRESAYNWIIHNQLDRRNLSPEQISYLRGKRYQSEKKAHGAESGGRGNQYTKANLVSHQNDDLPDPTTKTAERIAKELKVGKATIERDAKFAEAVDEIEQQVGTEAKHQILSRSSNIPKKDIPKLAKVAQHRPDRAREIIETGNSADLKQEYKEVTSQEQVEKSQLESASPNLVLTAPPMPVPPTPPQEEWMETIATNQGDIFVWHKSPKAPPTFNLTNDSIDWALWSWNPVTGCLHGCNYCYAREIANSDRMSNVYPNKFEPTYHPYRLKAPANTKPLGEEQIQKIIDSRLAVRGAGTREQVEQQIRHVSNNVFVCSMADLFGKWVPIEWIMAVFEEVKANPQWNFLFLTKFPQRLKEVNDLLGGFPDNTWIGTTVDTQARVALAERCFKDISAGRKWLSCEPLLERLTFNNLGMFDTIVIGGQSASYYNKTPEFQPEWEWVEGLWEQARASGTNMYWKENLTVRPKEMMGTSDYQY